VSALTIQYQNGGVFLPALGLWLDPRERQTGPAKVFVSHAHTDHVAAHREVILTAPTAQFMRTRLKGQRQEHVLPFGEPHVFGEGPVSYRLTLLPAGHILGSAMAFIEVEGQSLLYTGDFKLRRGLAAESCTPRHADLLVMETTFGRPGYVFPPADAVMQEVIRFCREALEQQATPVLFSYSLGKSQELLCGLDGTGLPVMLHESAYKFARIYEQFDQRFPAYKKLKPGLAHGHVLICPPQADRAGLLEQIGNVRTAIVSGWAVESSCRYRYRVDAAFPLSDHADFPGLIEMVKRVVPQKVFTLHGFAADFAQSVRELGFDAQALSEQEQFLLPLGKL